MKVVSILLAGLLSLGVLGLGVASSDAVPNDLDVSALEVQVLSHQSIRLRPAARLDVQHGLVDGRVLALLLALADRHELTSVGPLVGGHSYYVKGTTRPSNHTFGRAVDITFIDGTPVSSLSTSAYDAVYFVLSLPEPLRPDEVGSPWRFASAGSFTDRAHLNHVHLGWERPSV